ncbi:hypothetical protein [Mycobacterium aquaticum]|uniref:Uncharacterized protein n=1 Tax=Mycobacterium aquaticum TaxID=1927124 RepID=A0A1X0ABG9_9MYCO|nr:hypothetical protein [Mycobacterium aquaticum]ORA27352.1 hypothetical protein BST13_30295 [Mycobacterium aquaticum]
MSTISTVKKLTASGAMAGVLGLAALGLGSGLAAAAPAAHTNSGPASSNSRNSARNSWEPDSPEITGDEAHPTAHLVFPSRPASPHASHGHKGMNEPVAPVGIQDTFTSGKDMTMQTASPSTTGDKSGPKKLETFPVQLGDMTFN